MCTLRIMASPGLYVEVTMHSASNLGVLGWMQLGLCLAKHGREENLNTSHNWRKCWESRHSIGAVNDVPVCCT